MALPTSKSWLIRSIIGAILSMVAIVFGIAMILLISLFQLVFMPKEKWMNPFKDITKHNFTSWGCIIVCSSILYVIEKLAEIQPKIEQEFCIRK